MYLFGASGHAKVIIDSLNACKVKINGLFDDNKNISSLLEYPVLGSFSKEILKEEYMIISIGDNRIRKKVSEDMPDQVKYGIAVHPSSCISPYAKIGKGSVVMQGAIIQSCAIIGKHCIVNTCASIDHDCVIDDFAHISPNSTLCGNVKVGEGTQIGAGAVVIPGIKIGKWSLIAAGAVVMKDVPDNVLVLGNPARVIKKI